MGKQSFLKGAFTLVFTSFIVRTLGFIYQIIIVRLVGTEGIGIFNMVYPLYITAMVITTAGLPLAISKYVSEEITYQDQASAEHILASAVAILLFTSTTGAFLFIFISPHIIRYLYADPRVIPAFLILLPTLVLVGISSAFRSFFQGLQDMRPTAVAQLIEQIVRLICGIILVYILYPYGLTWAAVGLSLAILLSEVGGLIYIWQLFRIKSITNRVLAHPSLPILSKLFTFGIPVTVTRIIITAVTAAEASLIPHQLIKAGNNLSQAISFYGELTGVAFTLLMIPSTLTFALSTSLLPAISEAQSSKQKWLLSQRTADALGITLLAGAPSAIILYYWGPLMANLFFKANHAGELLQILAAGSIFLYLAQTSSGILQGLGCVKTIFITNLTCGLIRLSGIYYLGSHPTTGMTGIALSYLTSYLVLSFLNLIFIKFKTGVTLEWSFFLRLGFASIILIQLLRISTFLIQNNIILLISLTILLGLVFFSILLITGDKYSHLVLLQLFKK